MVPFAIAVFRCMSPLMGTMSARCCVSLISLSPLPVVQMVLFSELAPFGPLTRHATPLPGAIERVSKPPPRNMQFGLFPVRFSS